VERLENGKLYVLKAIHLADTSPREREAALAEVETLKRLQLPRPHPFVVRYLESFLWHDTLHIVMTYCAGGDLHAHLKERKAQGRFLPEHVIVDWLIQLLLAIRKCHESHIIHRDIKSSNIFLVPSRITAPPPPPLSTPASAQASTATADGTVDAATAAAAAAVDEPSFTLKLGDFGISKLLNSTSEMAMSIVGTPYSMSPEVCENKPYSFASDIWAIGM
jgi:NIMA (never in mitosis gene a)-related kinase